MYDRDTSDVQFTNAKYIRDYNPHKTVPFPLTKHNDPDYLYRLAHQFMASRQYSIEELPELAHNLNCAMLNGSINTKKATKWDKRMLRLAISPEVNGWSKDPSTKVSAVVYADGMFPIATSYNGFPPGVRDTTARLTNRESKYPMIQHAEANAVSTCARLGIRTEGTSIAISHFPCSNCAGQLITAGFHRIVVYMSPELRDWAAGVSSDNSKFVGRWSDDMEYSATMLHEAKVDLIFVSPDELGVDSDD